MRTRRALFGAFLRAWAVVFLLLARHAAAQELRLREPLGEIAAGPHVAWWHDPEGTRDLEAMRALEAWHLASGETVNLGFVKGSLWGRLHLVDERGSGEGVVVAVPYAPIDRVTLYEVRGDRVVARTAGDHVPRAAWPEPTPYATFHVEPFESVDLYVRVDDASLQLPLVIRSEGYESRARTVDVVVRAGYVALTVGLLLYNLLLWLATRLPIYGPYCGYAAGVLFTTMDIDGTGYATLWRDRSSLNDVLPIVGIAVASASLLRFQSLLLDLPHAAPPLARVNRWAGLAVLAALPVAVMLPWPYPMPYAVVAVVAMAGLTLHAAFVRAEQGSRSAKLFLAAFSPFIAAVVAAVLSIAGVVDVGPYWTAFIPAGSCLELVLFAYALADRIKELQREVVVQGERALASANEALAARELAMHELEERRRLQGELDVASQQLTQAENMATLGMLMAGIAHDIRNPLNYVQNAVEQLEEAIPNLRSSEPGAREAAVATVERVVPWVENGRASVDAISRAMRNQARMGGDEREAVNFGEVVAEALVLCRSRTTLCTLHVEVASTTVLADPTGLGQLVMNLVSNAADALKEHHARNPRAELVIRVRGVVDAETFTVEVHDNGPGIPESLRAKILEPFFTTKPRGVGTGLGLAIVQRVVRQHGGTLAVESSAELGGALFRAVFPNEVDAESIRGSLQKLG
jgi:two-component system, NtrC family, sensor kinase